MREEIYAVLRGYENASKQAFTDNPIAIILRKSIPAIIKQSLQDKERYIVKGSAGAGQWASIPWVAIFDKLITDTAQSGYYPVFLFTSDMRGVYLSLNQGVTEITKKYGSSAREALKLKAEDFRAQMQGLPPGFLYSNIKLEYPNSRGSDLARSYEAGNIFSKFYQTDTLPKNEEFYADIQTVLRIYKTLIYNESATLEIVETNKDQFTGFEDLRKFRFHKRIERNQQLLKKVKQIQGYICKACGIDFQEKYGELGIEFIEAHHLKPISQLSGDRVQLDARNDFTVLCSNCHSMIHRLKDPSDLDLLRSIILINKTK
jgi:5-methylcytosine-specific restriction protein A